MSNLTKSSQIRLSLFDIKIPQLSLDVAISLLQIFQKEIAVVL